MIRDLKAEKGKKKFGNVRVHGIASLSELHQTQVGAG